MLILVWCWLFVFLSWINSREAETRMWMLSFHSISWNVGLNIEICYPWVMSIHVNFLLISRNTELVKWMSLVSGCPLWKIRIKTTIILTLEANLFVLCLRKGSVTGVKLHGLYFCFKTQVYNRESWLSELIPRPNRNWFWLVKESIPKNPNSITLSKLPPGTCSNK